MVGLHVLDVRSVSCMCVGSGFNNAAQCGLKIPVDEVT